MSLHNLTTPVVSPSTMRPKPTSSFGQPWRRAALRFLVAVQLVLCCGSSISYLSCTGADGSPEPAKPVAHTARVLQGWTVRVDDRLLAPENAAFAARALQFLDNKLCDITAVVAPEPLAKLRKVSIVLDLGHGKLGIMQYHPSADWLRNNGYATNLAKCVHIPVAADLATPRNINEQPWVVLHELAHAYHDQVLDFDEPRVLQAYENYKKSGHGDQTLLFDGRRVRHYALTDHKEFFAEMTESYFGVDDFFPFNRAELLTSEPEIFELMQAVWGPVAGGRLQHPRQVAAAPAAAAVPATSKEDMGADSPVTFPKEGALPAKFPADIRDNSFPAEKDYYIFSSPCRSLKQIEEIQKAMPPGRFDPPPRDWRFLPRTQRTLTEGGDLRILALGDSIVNDTMRSGWVGSLAAAYPKANVQTTVFVRGGGGCQHYREEGRVTKYILPLKPQLVLIGGISQRDIPSIREVIHQVREALPETEFLLFTGAFGTADPRDPKALAQASYSGTGEYGANLRNLAADERCAYLDLTRPWADYIVSSKVHPHLFYRDVVHANEFGEQILGRVFMAFFGPARIPE